MKKDIKCKLCNDTGWVCENHPWKEAHVCECGGAGMPCKCNKADPPWKFMEKTTNRRK